MTVGTSVAGFFVVNASGSRMIEVIAGSIEQAEQGTDSLEEIAEKINKEWNSRSTLFKCVFIHDEFSEVEMLFNKLHFFAQQGSTDEFIECCNEAISRLRYTLDNEKPKIQNIF
ncbi:MAG: DUF4363 family protein [Clostridia bacterium]|nr:DUF4363 family protein [Clostridia bacterium]